MAPLMPRWTTLDFALLGLVLLAAAGGRAWYVSECADQGTRPAALQVQGPMPQDRLVDNLVAERWFGALAPLAAKEETTAHVAPAYPWLLASVRGWAEDAKQADQVMRWLQTALGTLTAAFYFFFARRAFASTTVGLVAGLLCAVYPFWIVNSAELNDGVLASFLLGAALALGTRASHTGGPLASLLYGLTLAGLAMTRAALLPFAAVALLWFLFRCRTLRRGWFGALLAFLGFANGLAPWTVRNFQNFNEIVPVADSAFFHLWIGNHPGATGGPVEASSFRTALPDDRLEQLLHEPNQARRYNMLARDVVESIKSDPGEAVARRLWAGLYFVFGKSWFDQRTLTATGADSSEATADSPAWLRSNSRALLAAALLIMLMLAFLGWRWTYPWRLEARLATLALLWIPLPYILSHADDLSGPRLPLDGVLLCFAAFVLANLLPGGAILTAGPKQDES